MQNKILAIDPGTREIGAVVLDGGELVYYAVKTIRDRGSAQRILRHVDTLVSGLIAEYQPDYLAIEKMFIVQKNAALLSVAAEEIKSVARESGLEIYEYAPTTVRKFICQNGAATKRDVARVVAERYPELARHLDTRNKWEEKYYANIFDAVAVGLMCSHQVSAEHASGPSEDQSQSGHEASVA